MNLQMVMNSFPLYIKEQFHSSDIVISLFTGLFAIAAIFSRLYAGQALAKGKRNVVLFTGLVIVILSTAGQFLGHAVLILLLLRIGSGLGFGLASTAFPTMAANTIPVKRMGEGMGYFGLSTSLAMSLGPIFGLFLLGNYGFNTLTWVSTLAIILILPFIFLLKPVIQPASNSSLSATPSLTTKQNRFFDKKLTVPASLNLLLSITFGGLIGFLALFGREVGIGNVGHFFLINAGCILLVRTFAGRIFDKFGPAYVLIPASLFVMTGLLILSFTSSLLLLIISAIFYGTGYGMIQPTTQAWMIKVVSVERRGIANSVYLNMIDLGVATGAIALGFIATFTNYATMFRLSSFFMVIFLIIFVGSLLIQKEVKVNKEKEHSIG